MENKNSNPEFEALSDSELLDRLREGDEDAYGELWVRYKSAGMNAARMFTSSLDHEDLVAEAFSRVLSIIRRGGGPRTNFRAYLVSAIRNLVTQWARDSRETTSAQLDYLLEAEVIEDFSDSSAESSMLRNAFGNLPERWQQILWRAEVYGESNSELSKEFGISTSAVAALVFRARTGLKRAWIAEHIGFDGSQAACKSMVKLLVGYELGELRARETDVVERHLPTCQNCSRAAQDAHQVGSQLKSGLLPTLLAGAFAASLAVGSASGKASAASFVGSSTVSTASESARYQLASNPALVGVAVKSAIGIAALTTLVFGAIFGINAFNANDLESERPSASAPESTATLAPENPNSDNSSTTQAPTKKPEVMTTPESTTSPPDTDTDSDTDTDTVTVPSQQPDAPEFTSLAAQTRDDLDVTITGKASPNAAVTVFVSGSQLATRESTVTATQAGFWSAKFLTSREGGRQIRAYQVDSSGQRSPLAVANLTVNWAVPYPAPVITSVDTSGGTLAPLVRGTGLPGKIINVKLNSQITSAIVNPEGKWWVQANVGARVGANTLEVVQRDLLTNNVSKPSVAETFVLVAPSATVVKSGDLYEISVAALPDREVRLQRGENGVAHTIKKTEATNQLAFSIVEDGVADEDAKHSGALTLRYISADGDRLGALSKTDWPQ